MNAESSSYYPPRSQGWGRLRSLFWALRRLALKSNLHLPQGFGALLAGFLLPGLALRLTGYNRLAWGIFCTYLALWILFMVFLGYGLDNLVLVAMMMLHALCLAYIVRRLRTDSDLPTRCGEAAGICCSLGLGYAALIMVVDRFAAPVTLNNRVYVIDRLARPQKINRGDWVAFKIQGFYQNGYLLRRGLGLGEVWATAGDRVEISPTDVRVNGAYRQRGAGMPETADFYVTEGYVFVWQDIQFGVNHGPERPVSGAVADQMRLRLATVSEKDVTGKVFHRWFFRKQI